jgi:hypothetical protein
MASEEFYLRVVPEFVVIGQQCISSGYDSIAVLIHLVPVVRFLRGINFGQHGVHRALGDESLVRGRHAHTREGHFQISDNLAVNLFLGARAGI